MTLESPARPPTDAVHSSRRSFLPRRASARRAPSSQTLVLVLILVSQLMVILDGTIVNIALQDIRADLAFSDTGLSWVVNAYNLTFGGLLLLGARAGDLLGRRRVFLTGLTLFAVASLAGGFAESPAQLLAARALQGVGGALASPTALALLMTMFPGERERTRAIGLYTAVSIGGAALGLIAGGMLSEWASWRWVFFVNVPIGVAVVLLGRRVLPRTDRSVGHFDLAGAITSTLGMTALVYGFVHAASEGWADVTTVGSFAVGLVLLAAFVVTELRAESPITPLRLFANRNRSGSYVARLLLVAGMMGMFYFLTLFLRGVLGYSDLVTGFAFLPLTIVVFASSQLSARIFVERFGPHRVMIAGISLSVLGMLSLTQLEASSPYWQLLLSLVVFGMGNGTAFVPLTTAALDGVEPADAGAASGLVNVMQQVGGALGLSVLVTVFGAARSGADVSGLNPADAAQQAFVIGAQHAFWTATAFLVATWLLVVFAIRPTHSDPKAKQSQPAEPALAEAAA